VQVKGAPEDNSRPWQPTMGTRCQAPSNECGTSSAEIALVVKDYLCKQLWLRRSFNWCPNLSSQPIARHVLPADRREVVVDSLCQMSSELLFDHEHEIAQMTAKFSSSGDPQHPIDYDAFEAVAAELFGEEIKWVHILTFLLFGCELALGHGVLRGRHQVVNDVHGHLTTYLARHVAGWIGDHQGWEGFVVWATERSLRRTSNGDTIDEHASHISRLNSLWSGSKMMKIGATVGALCIAAALVGLFGAAKH
jgi:hypothetical protein